MTTRDAFGTPLRTPNLHRGYCFSCGSDGAGAQHECPDPEYLCPALPPAPFVQRWDAIAGFWVSCMVQKNGTAWCPKLGRYTAVRAGETLTRPLGPREGTMP